MKNKLLTLLIILSVFTFSCRKPLKDVNDYFPKIKTISASVQTDGTLLLQGEIEPDSYGNIEYAGFCCSTNGDPQMLDRQMIATISGNTFSATYPINNFHVDSVYYFKSWATNDNGYAYGNVISKDSIILKPITPPCNHNLNYLSLGSIQTYTVNGVTSPTQGGFTWDVNVTCSWGPTVNFRFGSQLTTGIYTTTTSSSPGSKEVNVTFYNGFTSGALSNGSKVYINTIGSGVYDIVVCNAPWISGSATLYFDTHFVTP